MSDSRPIGVFDSGVGGLSVLRAIRICLPAEHLVYAADSAYAPYGDRPADVIETRAAAMVEFLAGRGVKAVVVACNTATSVAVAFLRARFTLPIVAMEPAVKLAAATTRSGVVGVLATTQTLSSANVERLVRQYGGGVRILRQPCPGLVECVERDERESADTRRLVCSYVRPLVEQGADTIVLGCTHYALLRDVIQDCAGPAVTLIDPAVAVARELTRRLEAAGLRSPAGEGGSETFWTTGPADDVQPVIRRLWGPDAHVREIE